MKVLLVLCVTAAYVGYASCDDRLQISLKPEAITDIQASAISCVFETGVGLDTVNNALDKAHARDPDVEKLLFCILLDIEVADDDGLFKPDKVLNLVDMPDNTLLKEIIETCDTKVGPSPTETATNVKICLEEQVDIKY